METEITGRLNQYAAILAEARKLAKDEQAALAIVAEVGKHLRVAQMAEERQRRFNGNGNGNANPNGDEQPATQRQLGYLKHLGVDIPKGLTKKQASSLIDESQHY